MAAIQYVCHVTHAICLVFFLFMYACIYVGMYEYVCMDVYMYVCMHVCINACEGLKESPVFLYLTFIFFFHL